MIGRVRTQRRWGELGTEEKLQQMKAFLQDMNAFLKYSALSDLQRGRELPGSNTLPADPWPWQQRGLAASGRDLAVGDEPARALANCLWLLVPPALEKGLRDSARSGMRLV